MHILKKSISIRQELKVILSAKQIHVILLLVGLIFYHNAKYSWCGIHSRQITLSFTCITFLTIVAHAQQSRTNSAKLVRSFLFHQWRSTARNFANILDDSCLGCRLPTNTNWVVVVGGEYIKPIIQLDDEQHETTENITAMVADYVVDIDWLQTINVTIGQDDM